MKRPRKTGSVFQYKGTGPWWIAFYRNGVKIRESSHSEKKSDAQALLLKRLGQVSEGTFIEPRDRKVTVDSLYAAFVDDLRNNGMASLSGAVERWQRQGDPLPPPGRLKRFFGGRKALAVSTDLLNRYVRSCQNEGLANATINCDLAALRRAFSIALRDGKLDKIPYFPHLKEAAARSGFIEESDYQKLAARASQLWLRALLACAYTFGFRKGELLNLRVRQVNLFDRTIRLNAGETKSGEGRVVKMTGDVFTLLAACVAGKSPDDYVFTREDGSRVLRFERSWRTLCKLAGLGGILFHDLRRSAIRNAVRRGVPEVVCMRISGHKTRGVFDRYDVVSEYDLAEAARKIEAGQLSAESAQFRAEKRAEFTQPAPRSLEN